MARCPKCNAELEEGANACGECGFFLADADNASSVPPSAASVPPSAASVPPSAASVPPKAWSVPSIGDAVSSFERTAARSAGAVPPSEEDVDKMLHDAMQTAADAAADAAAEAGRLSGGEEHGHRRDGFGNVFGKSGYGGSYAYGGNSSSDYRSSSKMGNGIPSKEKLNRTVAEGVGDIGKGKGNMNERTKDGAQRQASPVIIDNIKQEDLGACDLLKVSINYNDFAVSGNNSVVSLRITKLSDELSYVGLYWVLKNSPMSQIPIDLDVQELKKDTTFAVDENFTEDKAGFCAARFFVLCRTRKGDLTRYTFSHVIRIYDSNKNTGDYTFYIDNTQTASEAGYIRDNVINIAAQPHSHNDLLNQLRNFPQYFSKRLSVTQREFEKEVPSPQAPPRQTLSVLPPPPHTRLLLKVDDLQLFILNKAIVRLGREEYAEGDANGVPMNDFRIRIPGISKWPNTTVSARHGVLVIVGDTITYVNISKYGTNFDEKEDKFVFHSQMLPIDRSSIIGFGLVALTMQPCVFHENEQNDPLCGQLRMEDGDVCAVAFSHLDIPRRGPDGREIPVSKVKESYLIVPRYCCLGDLFPKLNGWTLFHWKAGFVVRTPDGDIYPLSPGMEIKSRGSTVVTVEEFKQS